MGSTGSYIFSGMAVKGKSLCYRAPPMSPAKKASGGGRKSSAKKTTARATKKTTTKKTAAKRATSRASKKTSARKTASRAPKKTVAKKTTAKKTAAKKPSAKKVPAKKVPAKKTATKKTVAPASPKKTTAKPMAEVAPKRVLPPSRPFVKPAPVALPKRKVRPAKFDADQLQKIRAGLGTKRGELEGRMAELVEDSFDATQSDITGEVGLDEDFADAGTATFERERDLSIRNNIRDLIDQMNRAIGRIDEGTYGTCERCGQPIDAARLRELPHASLCLDCKRREERAR